MWYAVKKVSFGTRVLPVGQVPLWERLYGIGSIYRYHPYTCLGALMASQATLGVRCVV